MSERFEVSYEVDDGYAGGDRPHYFYISLDELEDDVGEYELRDYYQEAIQSHFIERISPYGRNEEDFVRWAKEQLDKRKAEDSED